jgi:hypothetical protein
LEKELLRAAILDVVVELLTLLLHVREIPGSNLGPEIVNPEGFRGFPQSLQAYAMIVPYN